MRDVKDILRDFYGCTVHNISVHSGGQSRPGVLGLTTAPILVICKMVNKETKNTMSHALALVQNDNGCNTLYDGDERPVDLTTEDMTKFKDYAKKCKKDEITGEAAGHKPAEKIRLKNAARKVFGMCHGSDYSSDVRRSFFIQRKNANQKYRTDEEEEDGVLDLRMIVPLGEN